MSGTSNFLEVTSHQTPDEMLAEARRQAFLPGPSGAPLRKAYLKRCRELGARGLARALKRTIDQRFMKVL